MSPVSRSQDSVNLHQHPQIYSQKLQGLYCSAIKNNTIFHSAYTLSKHLFTLQPLSYSNGLTRPEKPMKSETDTDDNAAYAAIETEDGDLVIYDRNEETAWLQSDHTVDVSA